MRKPQTSHEEEEEEYRRRTQNGGKPHMHEDRIGDVLLEPFEARGHTPEVVNSSRRLVRSQCIQSPSWPDVGAAMEEVANHEGRPCPKILPNGRQQQ